MSKSILSLRKQIDQIDAKIVALCEARIRVSQQILSSKKNSKLKMIDKKRELDILKQFQKKMAGKTSHARIKKLFIAILQLNPKYPLRKK